MTRRRKADERPQLVALQCGLLARIMVDDPEILMAMQLIIAATQVGANLEYLKVKTDYDIDKICPLAERLREANIWQGKTVDAREWLPVFQTIDAGCPYCSLMR